MGPTIEIYNQNEDGTNTLVSTIPSTEAPDVREGYVDLIPTTGGSRATVSTRYASSPIILTRIQDNTGQVGNVFIHTPSTVDGESFQIRSTNASDAGTIFWQVA